MVTEFLHAYVSLLATHPEAVRVEITSADEGFEEITVYAHGDDVGKIIGKEGRMINAIKTVISGCKAKGGKSYRVNVKAA